MIEAVRTSETSVDNHFIHSSLMIEAVRTSETSVDNHFIHSSLMMEAVRTSETSVDNHFTRQYIPEDNSEHHTFRRENLKSHIMGLPTLVLARHNTETGFIVFLQLFKNHLFLFLNSVCEVSSKGVLPHLKKKIRNTEKEALCSSVP
jgi:hypothetical protein